MSIEAQARVRRWRNGSETTLETWIATADWTTRTLDVEVSPGDRVYIEHSGGFEGETSRWSEIRNCRFQTAGQNLWPGPGEVRLEGNDHGIEE